MYKTVVLLPTMENIYSRLRFTTADVFHGCEDITTLDVVQPENFITDEARNFGAKRAIESNADFILYIDDDMAFPQGLLRKLIKLSELKEFKKNQMFGGLYCKRGNNFEQLSYMYNKQTGGFKNSPVIPGTGSYYKDAAGTGCLLVNTSLFEELDFPYFKYDYDNKGNRIGEDMWFFKKTCSLDKKVVLCSDLQCIHFGVFGVKPKSKTSVDIVSGQQCQI